MKFNSEPLNQRGVIHHLGLLIFVVAVFAAVGFAGFRVYNDNQTNNEGPVISAQDDDDALASKLDAQSAALIANIDKLDNTDTDGDK